MKFTERLIRFMAGRNGMDHLNRALFWGYLICIVLGLFIDVFTLLALPLMILLFWRTFSRNLYKRRAENRKYLALTGKIRSKFSLQKRKFTERKTHRYRKCPHCKATLRLPNRKGKHTVCCPKCRKDFEVKI